MYKSTPILKFFFIGFALNLIFLFPSCDQILQPELAEIIDADNDGYDDRDILFLQKLIDNSQGSGVSPSPDMDPTDIGEQIWTDGRLRSLYHSGGLGGFWLSNDIPSEIEGAQYLNKIKLTDNYLTLIPEEIKNMPRLTEINLEKNRFVGPLPEELWKNKNLTSLAINNNSFSSFPTSMCEDIDNINFFLFTHNNFCEIPECISDPGVQSCDCFHYQNIPQESICLDSSITCNKYLNEIMFGCDLTQIWGQENFNVLTSLGSEACLDWSGNCSEFVSDTIFVDNQLYIDISDTSSDCGDNSYLDYLDWLGDGTCDEGGAVNFSCGQFSCDMGDCGLLSLNGDCYCLRDCSGNCKYNEICGIYYSQYGYDCCIDDGNCVDMSGDGVIQDAIGDGYCDDGSRGGFVFTCQEYDGFEFNCDGGDCGIWNEDSLKCVMPAGKTLKRRPSNFYSKLNDEK